jgi:hypothetical protein
MVPGEELPGVADETMAALDELVAVGRENVVAWMGLMQRVEQIRALRQQGVSYRAMELPEGPRLIDSLTANLDRLSRIAVRVRLASMRDLRREGMSIADIARAFGISRQRASLLLSEPEDRPATEDDS